jgi:hypothetical protein
MSATTDALERQNIDLSKFAGSSRNSNQITERLQAAADAGHLVSPMQGQCPTLPPFCEVALSYVLADTEVDRYGKPVRPGEIYKIAKDQYGLAKPFLNKIKRGVGVIWDPQQSGRVDDESHPHFARHFSLGIVMKFDGGVETIKGTKTLDLREGSARCRKIIAAKVDSALKSLEYKSRGDERNRPFKITEQMRENTIREAEAKARDNIRDARAEIETLAETGSELRALRSLGLKTSYTLAELKKPFIIASLVVTGKHDNPQYEQMFAEKAADQLLNARRSLFGIGPGGTSSPKELRAAPPPIDLADDNAEDLDVGDAITVDHEGEPENGQVGSIDDAARTPSESEQSQREEASGDDRGDDEREERREAQPHEEGFTFPFGDDKGKYLDDSSVSVASLEWLREWCIGAIANPDKANFKQKNAALKAAVDVELRRRNIPGNQPAAASGAKQQGGLRF